MKTKYPIVGILSMQKVINYGSYLQAYALKKIIKGIGIRDVEFLDILPGVQLNKYKQHSLIRKFKTIFTHNPFKILHQNIIDKQYYKNYKKSITDSWQEIGINSKRIFEHYSTVIIGSDEVFNCCQTTPWGFTTQLYGDIAYAEKIISYAGSFGNSRYDDLQSLELTHKIGKALMNIKAISVRDPNSSECIQKLIGITPEIHLDPVLIYGFKEELEKQIVAPDKEYLLIYTYPNRIKTHAEIKSIISFAKRNKLKIFSIMSAYTWTDQNIVASNPIDVLRWFKFANYIVTDTFHGTIFSIITHSKFATLIRKSNHNKLKALLTITNMQSQIVENPEDLPTILTTNIDYDNIEKNLEVHRKRTTEYLSSEII